ncbi:2-oxo-4-hydroxy-4-carboxy-5-ureidoimidazoline decarboxylase [Mycolicibacterium mageritense]|uniref:2-oxo-4-hydroxy-4-carboxy-5-ureidoimidazoline decarboxylase n=1 Tax=Mycolicibacterium mageritense TaxID=53462 RepID=A0AAI8XRC1_MYCME|nr:2-oxo-4-hydroxy-4-carboxy-5-ureidoimidazoline decarboxylase [Mycolicibacterium mageritense]BDY31917.1 Uric acid degradation bifunctional protein [Mycolicibacterium mageritense]
MGTSLRRFNEADPADAAAAVRPCLDVDRWVQAVVDGRPYRDVEAAVAVAQSAADPFTDDELTTALSHHPRIGERASGSSAEAGFSRAEQSGVSTDADVQSRLVDGNRAYEKRFGHVFLIRAAGRSSKEILAALEERLTNDPETEKAVMADQLRQIAVLRLQGVLT